MLNDLNTNNTRALYLLSLPCTTAIAVSTYDRIHGHRWRCTIYTTAFNADRPLCWEFLVVRLDLRTRSGFLYAYLPQVPKASQDGSKIMHDRVLDMD